MSADSPVAQVNSILRWRCVNDIIAQMEVDQKDRRIFVAFGGNKISDSGPPERTIALALTSLSRFDIKIVAISRFFKSTAFPPGSGPDYVNLVAEVASAAGCESLLAGLHAIEADFGRVRDGRWGARTLDLDLLAVGNSILPDRAVLEHWVNLDPQRQREIAPDRLILPHPRLQDRAFALIPWADIAPGWRHPLTGLSVAEMLAALPEVAKAAVRPF